MNAHRSLPSSVVLAVDPSWSTPNQSALTPLSPLRYDGSGERREIAEVTRCLDGASRCVQCPGDSSTRVRSTQRPANLTGLAVITRFTSPRLLGHLAISVPRQQLGLFGFPSPFGFPALKKLVRLDTEGIAQDFQQVVVIRGQPAIALLEPVDGRRFHAPVAVLRNAVGRQPGLCPQQFGIADSHVHNDTKVTTSGNMCNGETSAIVDTSAVNGYLDVPEEGSWMRSRTDLNARFFVAPDGTVYRKAYGASAKLRREVAVRDNWRCRYCNVRVIRGGYRYLGRFLDHGCQEAQIDHVIPVRRGGQSIAANLKLSCVSCNISKRDADNAEAHAAGVRKLPPRLRAKGAA